MPNAADTHRHLFRSVALHPHTSLIHEPSVDALKFVDSSDPQQLKQQPPLVVPYASVSDKRPASKALQRHVPGWNTNCKVARLGLYHPLETSHAFFSAAIVSAVLSKLVDCFKTMSLRVNYHDSQVVADCQSLEQVEFRVNVWESRQNSDQAILEIQRVYGDCVIFCNYAKTILSTITPDFQCRAPLRCLPMPTLLRAESTLQHVVGKSTEDSWLPALDIGHSLLYADLRDSRRLGLESLCIMTDSEKAGLEMARPASEVVLLGACPVTGASSPLCQIRDRVLRLVMTGQYTDSLEDEVHEHDKYLSLITLCNALKTIESQKVPAAVNACHQVAGCSLADALLQRVADALENPHEAYFSLQALEVLIMADQIKGHDVVPLVQQAHEVGSSSHDALATVARRVLTTLQV